jgi:hypothetical protein
MTLVVAHKSLRASRAPLADIALDFGHKRLDLPQRVQMTPSGNKQPDIQQFAPHSQSR